MSERNRRGRSWRGERRDRYPDENYGGERGAGRSLANDRGRSIYYGDESRERYGRDFDDQPRGDYNRGDQYRGDFGPAGERREWYGRAPYGTERYGEWRAQKPGHARENYERDDAGWSGRGEWGQRGGEGWERGRMGGGGFGSEFGAWQAGASNAGFGFGPEEHPDRDRGFEDTDWTPNRPARGRGTWAGDWSTSGEDYRGRGPKDYRRADDRIKEEVCDRLTDDPAVDAAEVNIAVENGEVTLTGTVPTREQKWRAETCIERISGVRDVINQLRVTRNEWANVQSPQGAPPPSAAPRTRR